MLSLKCCSCMLDMLCKLPNVQPFTAATVIMLETVSSEARSQVLKPAPVVDGQ